jgi:hypothetical protein
LKDCVITPLARGRIIQLNGSTRGGIKLTAVMNWRDHNSKLTEVMSSM